MARVLVTGATGFVGRHLLAHLASRGHTVRAAHRGAAPATTAAAVDWVAVGDLGPDTRWDAALEDIEVVVHLAGLAHQTGRRGQGRLSEFVRVNAVATRGIVRAFRATPTARQFILLSSVAAVGTFSETAVSESTIARPSTDYGLSKRLAELFVNEELHDSPVGWTILRAPLIYGPGNPGNMGRLIRLIETGLPLPFGSIRNRRSFLFVGNLIDLVRRCIDNPAALRHVFFASDGEDLSTVDLSVRLAKHAKQKLRMISVPMAALSALGLAGDVIGRLMNRSVGVDTYSVQRLVGSLAIDSTKVAAQLAWTPPFSVDEALAKTLAAL